MLPLNLIDYRKKNDCIVPRFCPLDDRVATEITAAMVEICRDAVENKMPRGEIEECLRSFAVSSKFAAAMACLLLNKLEFSGTGDRDFAAWRREVFTKSFAWLKTLPEEPLTLSENIYGDLPELDCAIAMPSHTVPEWLNLYNLTVAQTLVANAEVLEFVTAETDVAKLRKVLKYLKFFRLLVRIERGKNGKLKLSVSGPCSLFEGCKTYANALAAAFPAFVTLSDWRLSAQVKLKRTSGRFRLDQTAPITSNYRNFPIYIPEEIRMFHRQFAASDTGWEIVGETPFFDGGNQQLVFPDFSFRRLLDGRVAHMELFHRWHSAQLPTRLEMMRRHPEWNLVIGIDRGAANDEKFAELMAEYPDCVDRVSRFRDYPGVANTVKLLNRATDN